MVRPQPEVDWRSRSVYRTAGMAIAAIGLMIVLAMSIADFAVVHFHSNLARQDTLGWSFAGNFVGFTPTRVGVAVALMGIIIRLWMRVDSVKEALPDLAGRVTEQTARETGAFDTPFGRAELSRITPPKRWYHSMAEWMGSPMLAMGVMVVGAGMAFSHPGQQDARQPLVHGLEQVEPGHDLPGRRADAGGVAFILGTILSSLRQDARKGSGVDRRARQDAQGAVQPVDVHGPYGDGPDRSDG